ncbi:MAG: hypothetical protein JOZ18_13855, partial [Chloroflexi bacterium]|nr:hypothetical protein [Chloroflexota bacterium]
MFSILLTSQSRFSASKGWTLIVSSHSVLLLGSLFLLYMYLEPTMNQPPDKDVRIWLTTVNGYNKLSQQKSSQFGPDAGSAEVTIDVNEKEQLQQIEGFGAAMTDSSAWLIGTKMTVTQRNAVMRALFDPVSGIGISFVRVPMG